jgi:Protein of unknown function (DUF1553)/Protein of unknown function (DUF1549)/Planctomycete cytochrome C
MRIERWLSQGVKLAFLLTFPASLALPLAAAEIDFQRDVRPILSDVCFLCHGPDAKTRKGDFRLDLPDGKEGAFSDRGGYFAVKAGKLEESELITRILSSDPDEKMPPPKSGRQLTPTQIDTLRQWIAQGARWGTHWAFNAVKRTDPPAPGNPIDGFIQKKLTEAGLKPSPETDPERLIRRLALDLTGLPPTIAEVDAFAARWRNAKTDAERTSEFGREADRLMSSPHYGERMAMDWLDAARFADTNGYQTDETHDMSRWRQWVIDAFNRNQRFDQFTIEQLAGDLLPNPSTEQLIATGFNRNHRINTEGGSIPEEFLVETVLDRVATTSTVWLGLTFECARCHDHKYDPITMRDFYKFYAFFNTVEETGLGDRDEFSARGKAGNSRPLLPLATTEQKNKLGEFDGKIATKRKEMARLEREDLPAIDELLRRIEVKPTNWTPMTPDEAHSDGGAVFAKQSDGSMLVSGPRVAKDVYEVTFTSDLPRITGLRLELIPDPSLPKGGVGRADNGNAVISDVEISTEKVLDGVTRSKPRIAFATAEFSQDTRDVSGMIDGKADTAWSVLPEINKPHAAVFEFAEPIDANGGMKFIVRLKHDLPKGELSHAGRFRISLTADPEPYEVPRVVAAALKVEGGKRSAAETKAIDAFRRARSPKLRAETTAVAELEKERKRFEKSLPTTMIMAEQSKPRETFMLKRGQYDQPGEKVETGTPEWLNAFPANAPKNRLGLAQWLVDPKNPLTARVTVNRFWQMLFGTGLVKSVENFGSQAEPPTHPELLDWLASEFVRSGWDVKAMLKLMVTSATYRQSSRLTAELLERDPENRLLARAPRIRLSAEIVRDQALATSGLLTPTVGGRSVRPYQPAGLWEEIAFDPKLAIYVQDTGPELYRRSLYTFWKRTVPPPLMTTFDAPSREICVMKRSRTSTPLQALALMNETSFVEAARNLGQRMLREGGQTLDEQLAWAFRTVLSRPTSDAELKILRENHAKQLTRFNQDAAAADKLVSVGDSRRDPKLSVNQLAAATACASLILNLDEAVTKE